jgi:acetyl esterase
VMLERDELQWHQDNYRPSPDAATDSRVNILYADLTGLPDTTIILAECDPIRPQGERYGEALKAAGVRTRSHLTGGLVHGFFGLDEVFPSATEAMTFAGEHLADALAAVDR